MLLSFVPHDVVLGTSPLVVLVLDLRITNEVFFHHAIHQKNLKKKQQQLEKTLHVSYQVRHPSLRPPIIPGLGPHRSLSWPTYNHQLLRYHDPTN